MTLISSLHSPFNWGPLNNEFSLVTFHVWVIPLGSLNPSGAVSNWNTAFCLSGPFLTSTPHYKIGHGGDLLASIYTTINCLQFVTLSPHVLTVRGAKIYMVPCVQERESPWLWESGEFCTLTVRSVNSMGENKNENLTLFFWWLQKYQELAQYGGGGAGRKSIGRVHMPGPAQ